MSGKELDNLFRNKLEEVEKTPSLQAWDKLQSGLAGEQKKIRYPYWRVAAAILLLISFVGLFLWADMNSEADQSLSDRTDEGVRVSDEKSVDKKVGDKIDGGLLSEVDENFASDQVEEEKVENSSLSTDLETTGQTLAVNDNSAVVDKVSPKQLDNEIDSSLDSKNMKRVDVAVNEKEVGNEINQKLNSETLISSESIIDQALAKNNNQDATSKSNTTSSVQETKEEKSKALVFDIEEFDKKTAVAALDEGAQEEVKQSKFKKILNFVKNVKEGDGGMAGIREAKDDLFTFDSKKKEDDSE